MMLEKLGMAIANAQAALDANSIRLANEMASVTIDVGDKSYNLLSLGFTPAFYAFTEASLEMKMEFSMAESESEGIAGAFNIGKNKTTEGNENTETQVFGASISGHYARKFSTSVEGSSSIAAKIVSLPAPDNYLELLKASANTTTEA